MSRTACIILFVFVHNIDASLSGLLKSGKLELNIGKLTINTGSSDKDSDIYVLAQEDEEVKGLENIPDYTDLKNSNLEKSILKEIIKLPQTDKRKIKQEPEGEKSSAGSKVQNWRDISKNEKEIPIKKQHDDFGNDTKPIEKVGGI